MLDVEGFVSETNATNIFMVKGGALLTPAAGSCLPGITRSTVCRMSSSLSLSLSLSAAYPCHAVVRVVSAVVSWVCGSKTLLCGSLSGQPR